jgi:[protein-PII] uridylyltransferase
VDEVLRDLLGDQRGVAVVALGGYARAELCPGSDIDLLLVHDGWRRGDLEAVVGQLCYPLWDAGLSVGHAVRTPAEAVAAAGERIDTATALLDRRLVAGDRGLLDALGSRVDRWARRQRRRLTLELAEADAQRHGRYGDHPGALEPELKNGAGGLRDLHSLRWAGAWALGEISLDALVNAGYVGARDRRSLTVANDALLQVRCALHLARPTARGHDADVLRLQDQDDVAALLGLHDGQGRGDGDALLRRVGLATRTVAHVHGRAWPLLLADAGGRRRRRTSGRKLSQGVRLDEGLVEVDAPAGDDPAWALQAVAAAAQQRAHLTRSSAALVQRIVTERAPLDWNAAAREALLEVLRTPGGALRGLQDADHLGVLSAFLPDWEVVRGRPQRNPLHRFDLDTHGAHAVHALHELVAGDELASLWNGLEERDALLLAVWLHDVGKAWPGDHSEVGADVVTRWLSHMGFASHLQRQVSHLVRWHLLLPDVATRRDLDDPDEIAAVASVAGDPPTADALYLLSLADGRATGPAAWSAWKDSLMARLHAAVRAHLGAPLPDGDHDRRPAPAPDPDHQALLEQAAPRRYFDTADLAQQAAHAELLRAPCAPGALHTAVRPGVVDGTAVVSVVARDRPGMFADCAGVFSAHELDVVEARAFTGPEGHALDWFTIQGWVDGEAVLDDLVRVAGGERSVEGLLTRRRRVRPTSTVGGVDVTIRDPFTVEVQAPNTPGLLYRLCVALRGAGLNVTAARISSVGPSVFDVFEVVPGIDAANAPAVERALLSAAAPSN